MLGTEPLRLPVLHDDGDCIALLKPPGILVQQDTWFPRLPVLVEAIRYQAAQGKPEFRNLGIGEAGLWAVHDLDPELGGPVLFARKRETAEKLRSLLGSDTFSFEFVLLVEAAPPGQSVTCELPLARHEHLPKTLVSHTTGKKSSTEFEGLGRVGRYGCCIARTSFPRRHQIFVHALESRLPILGDTAYARSRLPYLSRIKRDYRPRRDDREERPLFPGPAAFLRQIQTPHFLIEAPEPQKWRALCRQIDKYTR